LRAAVERCRSCKGRCAASCNYTSLHGMRDLREFVASLSRAAHPMWSFALEDKKEHVVRKRVPTRRAVFGRFKAPAIIDHQPPRWQARGRDKDAGRARVSRNVRADRTAWLSGCSSSLPHLIGYTSSASIPQTSPTSRDRKPPDPRSRYHLIPSSGDWDR
jgi:hypothetical protein